jgi:hypothetical protein
MPKNYKDYVQLMNNSYPNCVQLINEEQEDSSAVCFGYKYNIFKRILFYLLAIVSCGGLLLLCYWKPEWRIFMCCRLCELKTAQIIVVKVI